MISDKEIEALCKGMAPAIKEYVDEAVEPLRHDAQWRGAGHRMNRKQLDDLAECIAPAIRAAIEPLKREIAELKARPSLKWVGVYDRQREYQPGECVTSDGSVFHSNIVSKGLVPGTGTAWTLIVKRGRDGKR